MIFYLYDQHLYIAKTLINALFTNFTFHRDREGDGSDHYESEEVMSPHPQCHLRACSIVVGHGAFWVNYPFNIMQMHLTKVIFIYIAGS